MRAKTHPQAKEGAASERASCRFMALDTAFEGGSCGVFQIQGRSLQTLSFRKWPEEQAQESAALERASSLASAGAAASRKPAGAAKKSRFLGKGLFAKSQKRLPGHSDSLPEALKETLEAARLRAQDLDFFAVDIGPGRWTGVRIGLDCIKTLAFLFKKPIQPLHSLEIAAERFISSEESVFLSFNGFKNSVYYGKFLKGRELAPPSSLPLADWEQICRKSQGALFAGDMDRFFDIPKSIRFVSARPDARAMAQILSRRRIKGVFQKESLIDWRKLSPLYLRSP